MEFMIGVMVAAIAVLVISVLIGAVGLSLLGEADGFPFFVGWLLLAVGVFGIVIALNIAVTAL